MSDSSKTNVIDLNLIKLEHLYQMEENELRFSVLDILITEYLKGTVKVDWENGEPLFRNANEEYFFSLNDIVLDNY